MTDDPVVLDQKEREAVHAAREAAQADLMARKVQIQEVASKITENIPDEQRMAEVVREQVEHVLAKGTEQERAMIYARVPYICQDIKDIRKSIEGIEANIEDKFVTRYEFSPVRMLAYGLAGLLLTATVGAMVAAIFK